MRILQVQDINQVANLYSRALVERGHIASIYQPNVAGGNSPLAFKLAMMPGRVFSLRQIIGRLDAGHFDLAHIHWASYGVLGVMGQIPFVLQCHGTDVRNRLKTPFFRALLAPVFRRAGAVLCITPDLLAVTRALRPDALYFPAPVDVERFRPAATPAARPWTIFLFARLDPEKRVDLAVEGISAFVQRCPGVRVQVVAWGQLSQEYQRRYGQQFDFLPRVPPEAVPGLLAQADVVVGQLGAGVLGLSELQGMSSGKPVITRCQYEGEYPTPPPIWQAATAAEVTAQLERLYHSPAEAAASGQKAREWVIAHHRREVLAARLEALYRALLP